MTRAPAVGVKGGNSGANGAGGADRRFYGLAEPGLFPDIVAWSVGGNRMIVIPAMDWPDKFVWNEFERLQVGPKDKVHGWTL